MNRFRPEQTRSPHRGIGPAREAQDAKGRRRRHALTAVIVAAACGLAVSQAHATVVLGSGSVASAIDDLIVDGNDYNVQWVFDVSQSTFEGNLSDAQDAANAIDAALNGTSFIYVSAPGVGSINGFVVQDAFGALGDFPGIESLNNGTAGTWHNIPLNDDVIAEFTPVSPVPISEPTSLALLGVGLLGLGASRWRWRGRSRARPHLLTRL